MHSPTLAAAASALTIASLAGGLLGSAEAASGPPANTSAPSIGDTTPRDGNVLTAWAGSWSGTAPISFVYQWLRCDVGGGSCLSISAGAQRDYTVVSADVGSTLRVRVTASNSLGSTIATSTQTDVVDPVSPTNLTLPIVTGTAAEGASLTTTPGTWAGTPPIIITYRWKRCDPTGTTCGTITGATAPTYTPTSSDAGSTLRSAAVATNAANSITALSLPTAVITPLPPRNTSPPSISDTTPRDTNQLTAYPGSWAGAPPIVTTTSWQRCNTTGTGCQPIPGAAAPTYTVTSADVGHTLRATITATNPAGSVTATTAPTATVTPASPTNLTPPTVSGTAAEGATLTTTPGTWAGTPPITITYRWKRCDATGTTCGTITGAINPTYTLTYSDAGSTIRSATTATNAASSTTALSQPTTTITPLPPRNTNPPTISDTTPKDTDQLTAYPGSWTGAPPITTTTSWQRCNPIGSNCQPIPGATNPSYTTTATDVGHTLRATVTATNPAGPTIATTTPTAAVTPASPTNLTPPTISGTARDGETLTATPGSWAGTPPIALAYRWKRCDAAGVTCATITGQTSASYVLTSADVASAIVASVVATNAGGSVSFASSPTSVVVPRVPAATTLLSLTGDAREGEALAAGSPGTWTGTPPLTLSYAWLRCDTAGSSCLPISGAVSDRYTLTSGDVGTRVRLAVTATNGAGSTEARSSASPVVAAAGAPLFSDGFDGPDRLLTNAYAGTGSTNPNAVFSPNWIASNGSLFSRAGHGWTGVPDGGTPDATSTSSTGSAIFRLYSRRADFGDVALTLSLRTVQLVSTTLTPATPWDGAHLWLRYQNETSLYAVSVHRRDGTVVIKKKCTGGTSNGGTYYTLATASRPFQLGVWDQVQTTVKTVSGGSVRLELYIGGQLVIAATDAGLGCAPITTPGSVGIRGDNAELDFDDVTVRPI